MASDKDIISAINKEWSRRARGARDSFGERGTDRDEVLCLYDKYHNPWKGARFNREASDVVIPDVYQRFHCAFEEYLAEKSAHDRAILAKLAKPPLGLTEEEIKNLHRQLETQAENSSKNHHGEGWRQSVAVFLERAGVPIQQEMRNRDDDRVDIVLFRGETPVVVWECETCCRERYRGVILTSLNNRPLPTYLVTMGSDLSDRIVSKCERHGVKIVCPKEALGQYNDDPNVISLDEALGEYEAMPCQASKGGHVPAKSKKAVSDDVTEF